MPEPVAFLSLADGGLSSQPFADIRPILPRLVTTVFTDQLVQPVLRTIPFYDIHGT
jgi:hypothetical protein